jgi:hypothetical protein
MSALDRVTGPDWYSPAKAPPAAPRRKTGSPRPNKQTARSGVYDQGAERLTGLSENKSHSPSRFVLPFHVFAVDNHSTLCYTISDGSYG